MGVELYNGDCLEVMPIKIPDKSVDMILCDLHLIFLSIVGILSIKVLLWIMN